MRLVILVLIAVIFSFSLQAQDRDLLNGKITNDSLLSQVHVINITSEKGTLSGESGEFILSVKPGDSILFSSVQYKNITIAVRKEMLAESFEIELENELTELDEVKLHELSGNLLQDIGNMETLNQAEFGIPYSDKKPPNIVERKISGMSSPMDPAGLLYGAISGERRKLKQARENQRENNRILKARNLLSEEFYNTELGLKKSEVLNFLYYCAENPLFMRLVNKEDLLGLIEFYKKTIPNYQDYISLD
ncbi:peptidase associated/transthyretin-like domain-containing protein [Salegentibacter flavus]|uniref:CarboxypepD_reg-like domain-containing protein n=1 Tax=Salegentibacter flavus TaxID=287099 RepID=A0A1I4XUI4_9FLAO|nr:hypothetical protein [Salegentibacter flavus]SFN29417.1 hypothetical protein SAMN05660413_00347 [Salegentibacter flavus]